MTLPSYMMMWEWRYPPPTFPIFCAISMFSKVLKERAGAISFANDPRFGVEREGLFTDGQRVINAHRDLESVEGFSIEMLLVLRFFFPLRGLFADDGYLGGWQAAPRYRSFR